MYKPNKYEKMDRFLASYDRVDSPLNLLRSKVESKNNSNNEIPINTYNSSSNSNNTITIIGTIICGILLISGMALFCVSTYYAIVK